MYLAGGKESEKETITNYDKLLKDPEPLRIQQLIDDDDLADASKSISLTRATPEGENLSPGAIVLQNLIESNLFFIHKQYPVGSFYSTNQLVEADIYLL